jgi:prevent-host-death family protein
MKVVSITDVRQEATKLVEHAQETREPVLICVRSKPVAYIVEAEEFEAMQRELKRLRYTLFWQGVAEAEAEHRAGLSKNYDNADEVIAALGLET